MNSAQLVVRSDFGGGSRVSATSPRSSSNSVNAGRLKDSTFGLEIKQQLCDQRVYHRGHECDCKQGPNSMGATNESHDMLHKEVDFII